MLKQILLILMISLNAIAEDVAIPDLPKLPELPTISEIQAPQNIEVIDISNQGSKSDAGNHDTKTDAKTSNNNKTAEPKDKGEPVNLFKDDPKPESGDKLDAKPEEKEKQEVSDKFKLPQDKQKAAKQKGSSQSLPFPTNNLIDIPPLHKQNKLQQNDFGKLPAPEKLKKRDKQKQENVEQKKEIKKEQEEMKAYDMEKTFNLDYKVDPGELKIYDNRSPDNQHLPELANVEEYKYAAFVAIDNADMETFEEYAKRIGNYEFKDEEGNTLLIYAVMNDQSEMVEWLLKHKVNVNARNNYGATALHAAVINNNAKLVRMLIEAHADKSIKDQEGKMASEYALSSEVEGLVVIKPAPHNKIEAKKSPIKQPKAANKGKKQ